MKLQINISFLRNCIILNLYLPKLFDLNKRKHSKMIRYTVL